MARNSMLAAVVLLLAHQACASGAATLEANAEYQACLASPSTCTELCVHPPVSE
jgi:hypothetical protein